ncbi:lipid II flippase Amj family protein [Paenibacillus sp. MBLB4367]|uniref:lipid II flippase Amj family protein n=1 Tax=Paenibacillus sp. MBLB4367 TaxID=3384767 RepID=UPI0039082658
MLVQLLIVAGFTLLIHMAETLSFAVRLAGVRTGKLAVALSLTGIIVLVSRTSNMLQGPLIGNIIDTAKTTEGYHLAARFHFIIASASIGTLLAILLVPTCISIASRLIAHLEVTGSIPQLIRTSASVERIRRVKKHVKRPRWEMLSRLRIGGIPKRLLLLNCLATAIYTVGVLSALYASYLIPEASTTASQASGLINGIATVLLTVLVDPRIALLTDKTTRGEADIASINKMFGLLMLSRFAGTLLAQLLLVPGALWIKWVVSLM